MSPEEEAVEQAAFRNMFAATATGIATSTPEGRFIQANAAYCRMLGYTESELQLRNFATLTHPADLALNLKLRDEMLAGARDSFLMEKRYLKKNGDIVWTRHSVSAARGVGGEITMFIVVAEDITERKRTEHALRQSEERLRLITDLVPHGIFAKDAAGCHIFANPALAELAGLSIEEILGKSDFELVADKTQAEAYRADDLAVIKSGRKMVISEEPRTDLSGRTRFLQTIKIPFTLVETGEPAILGICMDITERKQVELELQRQQAELRALFDLIPAMVWFKDTENNILRVNQRVADAAGKSIAEIEGKSILEIYPQEAAKYYADDLEVIRAGVPRLDIVERLRDSAGKESWVQTGKVPYRDAEGKIAGIVVMAQNITEQKRTETRFRRLFESNVQAVFLWNTKGEIIGSNDAFLKLTRYSREDLEAGRINWAAMTPPEYADLDRRALQEIADKGVCTTYEKEWICKDGARIPILLGATIFDDNPEEGVCFVLDLTERKQSQSLLHLRDRAIRAVSQAILITDSGLPDNPIVYASPSFEQMTGYAAAEAIGRNCRFLQGRDTDPQAIAQIRDAIREERACTVELLNYRKDGTSFWNSLTVSPVRDEGGKLMNFVGVQTDVTPRRKLEEQLRQSQKMEAIGRLAGGIAHDFNNLLTVINGYSDVLIASLRADDPSQRFLGFIKEAGDQSAALTNQLLAFSKNQFLSPKAINLNDIVRKVGKMLQRIIGEDIKLAVVLSPILGNTMADPTQIEQILLNLAVNARDAMPQGGQLTIETCPVALNESYTKTHLDLKPGSYVMLAITDTGVGIPDDVKPHIFEPFFTTKGIAKGTGLGLSVVHGVVKQSGGSIEVYSEPGQGTCFKIYLPQIAGPARQQALAPDKKSAPLMGNETILLVEDETYVREFARHVLEGYGYTVLVAATAIEALQISAAQQTMIHLLLTDVVMPETGGRALAEELQLLRPDMKVLFMSGYTEDAVVRHGILHEEVNFLQKPYSPLALAQKIRDVLR